MAAEECDIWFMKIGLTGGILQSIVYSGPLLFWPSIAVCAKWWIKLKRSRHMLIYSEITKAMHALHVLLQFLDITYKLYIVIMISPELNFYQLHRVWHTTWSNIYHALWTNGVPYLSNILLYYSLCHRDLKLRISSDFSSRVTHHVCKNHKTREY